MIDAETFPERILYGDSRDLPTTPPEGYAYMETRGDDASALSFRPDVENYVGLWRRDNIPEADEFARWLLINATPKDFEAVTKPISIIPPFSPHNETNDYLAQVRFVRNGSEDLEQYSLMDYWNMVHNKMGPPDLRESFLKARFEAIKEIVFAGQPRHWAHITPVSHFKFEDEAQLCYSGHQDGVRVFIERYDPFGDAGTIYSATPYFDLSGLFRVQSSSVSVHGSDTWHAFPTRTNALVNNRRLSFPFEIL